VSGPTRGLMFGEPGQLAEQAIGVGTNIVFVFGTAYALFRALDRLVGNRLPPEIETAGLDDVEMGSDAYPRD
jgi:ammonium transporter, Amt family